MIFVLHSNSKQMDTIHQNPDWIEGLKKEKRKEKEKEREKRNEENEKRNEKRKEKE